MRYKIETERENLFDVNMMISMRVRLNGKVDTNLLRDAFYKAVASYEILNSKVVIEENGDAFYVDCDKPLSSISETDMGFEDLINSNEKVRFKIESGEYIRCFITPDGLVFLMHHLGGDGKSLLYFIETFMRSLSGETVERIPFDRIALSDLPKESGLPFSYKLFVDHWNRKWTKRKRTFGYREMDEAFESFWKDHISQTKITTYNKEELDSLLAETKKAGCTLTSYLIAFLIKDMPFKANVGMAVDGRLSDRLSMGNFATGIHIDYRYDPNKTIWENAVMINKLMRPKLENIRSRYAVLHLMGTLDPTLVDTLSLCASGYLKDKFFDKFAETMTYGKKKRDISVTNLMRADIPTVYGSFEILDIAFVPPVVSYGKNLIGIITVNDKMTVTYHSYKD